MADRPNTVSTSFTRFLWVWISSGWEKAHKKYGKLTDAFGVLAAIGLVLFARFKASHPKADTSAAEAGMSYWLAAIPLGIWVVWIVYHFLKAPYEICLEICKKHDIDVNALQNQIKVVTDKNEAELRAKDTSITTLTNQLDGKDKRKDTLASLGVFHIRLTSRVAEIKELRWFGYRDKYENSFKEDILDPDTAALLNNIATYLQEHVGGASIAIFRDRTTLKITPVEETSYGGGAPRWWSGVLDNLNHFAMQLMKIIDGF